MTDEHENGKTPRRRRTLVRSGGDWSDTAIAVVVAGLLFGALILFIVLYEADGANPRLFLFLAGTVGSALGWGTGIILSPYDSHEQGTFGGIGKAILSLVTGYAAAKLEPIVSAWVGRAKDFGVPVEDQLLLAVSLVTFVIACALTYISRRYWLTSDT